MLRYPVHAKGTIRKWKDRFSEKIMLKRREDGAMPELTISPEKVTFVIEKAR